MLITECLSLKIGNSVMKILQKYFQSLKFCAGTLINILKIAIFSTRNANPFVKFWFAVICAFISFDLLIHFQEKAIASYITDRNEKVAGDFEKMNSSLRPILEADNGENSNLKNSITKISKNKNNSPNKPSFLVKNKIINTELSLQEKQVARLLRQAGFPKWEIPKLVCLARWESSFNPNALNKNVNGSQDTGLFQINDVWLSACKTNRNKLLDPVENTRCAYKVWHEQGTPAWVANKDRVKECNIFIQAKGKQLRNLR